VAFLHGGRLERAGRRHLGGRAGRLANGEYFTRICRELVSLLEEITDEGYVFRVDLRLRPEGRMGPIVLSLDGYRAYYRERAELWERQALIKSRIAAGDAAVGARFASLARETVYRPGVDASVVPAIRAMKAQIDGAVRAKGGEATNVKLGRGGIREIEFIVQALQLLYGGDDPWLREANSLKAIFRLTERGYLAPDLGRQEAHDVVYDACRVANEKGMTLADALSADPRASARIDRATIDRLTSPRNYLGLAPEMVERVLASSKR